MLSINKARELFAKGETELTVYERKVTMDISLTLDDDGKIVVQLHISGEW